MLLNSCADSDMFLLSFDCIWQQDLKSSALLYAHRCFLRDVALAVPSPTNTIPDLVLPSHIVVPRCAGTEHQQPTPAHQNNIFHRWQLAGQLNIFWQVYAWTVWVLPACRGVPGWRPTR